MSIVFPPLYVIMDTVLVPNRAANLAASLVEAGVRLIQIRDKSGSVRQIAALSAEFMSLFSRRGLRLIINDRADVAAVTNTGGVHIGQRDISVEGARIFCPPPLWVGVSAHTLEQVREANASSADYIAIGPIFTTTTKAKPDPTVGVGFIRDARVLTRKPLVAIGGITAEAARDVFRAGADSVAVARDVLLHPNPAQRARKFLVVAQETLGSKN